MSTLPKNYEFDVEMNALFTLIRPSNREGFPTGPHLQKAFALLHTITPVQKITGIVIKLNGVPVKFTGVSVNVKDEIIITIEKT